MSHALRREYPDRPWVGVGVVARREGRVLLVRRARPPRLGQWGLPGGAQHVGETVAEAAVREVREETGLEVVPAGIVTVVDGITRDAEGAVLYHYTLVEVAADAPEGDPVAGDDVDAVRWATPEEAASLVDWGETMRVITLALRSDPDAGGDPP